MENLKIKRNNQALNGEKYSVQKFRIRALSTELDVIKVLDGGISAELTDDWTKPNELLKVLFWNIYQIRFLIFATPERTAREILNSLDVVLNVKVLPPNQR